MRIAVAFWSGLVALSALVLTACGGGGSVEPQLAQKHAADAAVRSFAPSEPPADLWQPPADSTPSSGNYVYLQSDAGDYIGQGGTYTYTQANAILTLTASGVHLGVSVQGDERWSGDFQGMSDLSQLVAGYYPDLTRYPFNDPTKGGLNWSGQGRGCNTLTGWFVVDSITYDSGGLTAIDLRFEQHCEGAVPALHGKIHWVAGDTTAPPGPVDPPPAELWQPALDSTPSSGNYVYLQSDPGDYIGAGGTYTYTPADSAISISSNGGLLHVAINGSQAWWIGDFQAMSSITTLQPGYYGHLMRYPFGNPAKGGLSWYGQGRGCNTLTGWFVVDGVNYVNGSLTAIDLRFEQHCEGAAPALHGKIHWDAPGGGTPAAP